MINRIGRGDRGEVWCADDLVLQTEVALKLIDPASQRTRERILSEIRLARQITHPAVCRIFDVGEADDRVFYSMELVQGEDLQTLLSRAGRLPSEKVIDIGRQLCGGLATAHAHGVLTATSSRERSSPKTARSHHRHRFRSRAGRTRAIAADRGDRLPRAEQRCGAPGFRANGPVCARRDPLSTLVGCGPSRTRPAARARRRRRLVDGSISARTRHPAVARRESQPSSAVAAAIAEVLEHDAPVMSALGVQPAIAVAGPWRSVAARRARLVVFSRARRALTDQDTIVVADVMNTTGEPVFDGALKVALAVALEQSPFLKVFPDERVIETLRLMERRPDERVTRSLARDIARREQLKALVAGSIGSLGSHYVIALEAINAETGDVMAREQVEAAGKEAVLTSLGAATSKLRETGQSLSSIQVRRAAAASHHGVARGASCVLLAMGHGTTVPGSGDSASEDGARARSGFAMAQALLSAVYANSNQSAEAPAYARRAFELRNRVSERERFFLSWRYYIDAEQAWDNALELARSWTATYPREAFAFNSLGVALGAFGQHAEAVRAFREAMRIDPRFVPPRRNLAGSLIALDRFDEAASVLNKATADGIDSVAMRQMGYLLVFLAHKPPAPIQPLRARCAGRDVDDQLGAQPRFGAAAMAHELFQRAIQAAPARISEPRRWTIEDAESHAMVGQCAEALQEAPAGLALARDNFTIERASRALAMCDAAGDVSGLTADLARRFPNATVTTRIQVPVAAAAVASRRGDAARALAQLEPVRPYDQAPAAEFWPAYLRGQAYLQSKDARAAIEQFRSILDHRGGAPTSPHPLPSSAVPAGRLAGDTARHAPRTTAFSRVERRGRESAAVAASSS